MTQRIALVVLLALTPLAALDGLAQPCPTITVRPIGALPGGDVGYAYSQTLTASSALWDQTDNLGGDAWVSQNFESYYDYYDNRGADDFVVPAGQNWSVDTVDVGGGGTVPPTVNVTVYDDAAGLPGAVVCDYTDLTTFTSQGGSLTITLPSTCALGPGTYWVSVQANNCIGCGWWLWSDVLGQSGSPAAWTRNCCSACSPGWGPRQVCLGGEPDNSFALNRTVGTYTFAVTGGALPPGLALSPATGVISGTPTTAGSYGFTVTADDGGGCTGSRSYTIDVVVCAMVLGPASPLPGATAGSPYRQILTATGGTGPYTFALTGAPLPPGLSLDASGVISGIPTGLGTFTFDVTSWDLYGCNGSRSYDVTVSCPVDMLPAFLYDQTRGQSGGGGYQSQNYESIYDAFDNRGADDFAVPLWQSWSVEGLMVLGYYDGSGGGNGPPASIDVSIHADATGLPGADVCSYPGLTTFVDSGGIYTIALSSPCVLGTGRYWVSVMPNMAYSCCGFWRWRDVSPQLGDGAAWENPGGGWNSGCTPTWGLRTSCLGGQPDNSFALLSSTVATANLPDAMAGNPYSYDFADVGVAPFTYTITSGSLPPGQTVGPATGRISGRARALGTFTFTLSVSDANGCLDSQQYSITVVCGPVTPVGSPPTGTQGASYSYAFASVNGVAPYTYAMTGGLLPVGMSLSPAGLLSGAPLQSGTFSFAVAATDVLGCSGTQIFSLFINPVWCGGISLSPPALPDGVAGTSYSQGITASGGIGPYAFSVSAGSLPPGLQLLPFGLLDGTPSAPGVFAFTVTATDDVGCAGTRAYAMMVTPRVDFVAGKGLGQPNSNEVRVYSGDGLPTSVDFLAYGAGAWGVNVASGDLDGGGYGEVVTGPGPGQVFGPQVRGFRRDGTGLAKINYFAYATLRYGANVASTDLDADAFAELLTGPGPGTVFGPQVRGWDYDGVAVTPMGKVNYFAYGTLKYGVNAGGDDLDADGFGEIVTGPGPGAMFGAQVRGWNYDGTGVTPIAKINFNAFTFAYGVHVAAGDVDGDGFAEMTCAPGPGAGNAAQFRGFDYDGNAVVGLPGFDLTPFTTLYGGRPGVGDVSADGRAELLAGAGRDPAADSRVLPESYNGVVVVQIPGAFTPFGAATYGVNVAGGALGF